jgi:hypothetical protein
LEREILANLAVESAVLDISCGRSVPSLSKSKGQVRDLDTPINQAISGDFENGHGLGLAVLPQRF